LEEFESVNQEGYLIREHPVLGRWVKVYARLNDTGLLCHLNSPVSLP
jgi:hypothetical protein